MRNLFLPTTSDALAMNALEFWGKTAPLQADADGSQVQNQGGMLQGGSFDWRDISSALDYS
ncbi:MAG: hypothetical protein EA399_04800 [Desulfovibrionales bacterium]|nr:MAG: hypothetical protein EA399_04800 [Desulfovibrionales bacterium]